MVGIKARGTDAEGGNRTSYESEPPTEERSSVDRVLDYLLVSRYRTLGRNAEYVRRNTRNKVHARETEREGGRRGKRRLQLPRWTPQSMREGVQAFSEAGTIDRDSNSVSELRERGVYVSQRSGR